MTIFAIKLVINRPAPIITAPSTTLPPISSKVLNTFVNSLIPRAFIAAVSPVNATPIKPIFAITLEGTKFVPLPSKLAKDDNELSIPKAGNVLLARLETNLPIKTNMHRIIAAPIILGIYPKIAFNRFPTGSETPGISQIPIAVAAAVMITIAAIINPELFARDVEFSPSPVNPKRVTRLSI